MRRVVLVVLPALVLLALLTYKFKYTLLQYFPAPKTSVSQDSLIAKDLKTVAFHIDQSGDHVVFAAVDENKIFTYSYNTREKMLRKLDHDTKLIDWYDLIGNLDSSPSFPFMSSYMDSEGNVYFEGGTILAFVGSNKISRLYKYLPQYLLHTTEELENKSTSKLFRSIISKYSKEPIKVVKPWDNQEFYYFLIELDAASYYITSNSKILSLERFPLDNETVSNLEENQYRKIQYRDLWDPNLGRMVEKAKIDTIIETVAIEPVITLSSKVYPLEFSQLIEDREYAIVNGSNNAAIHRVCFGKDPTGMAGCKEYRIILSIGLREHVLSNNGLQTTLVTTEHPSENESPFIYIPYDRRFFTNDGTFIFLSRDGSLFAL